MLSTALSGIPERSTSHPSENRPTMHCAAPGRLDDEGASGLRASPQDAGQAAHVRQTADSAQYTTVLAVRYEATVQITNINIWLSNSSNGPWVGA